MASIHRRTSEHRPADVLVIFGISGDLAKVMTFRSLHRLERRGLLTCPVVGVAVDDWTTEDLCQHARKAIAGTGEPLEKAVFEEGDEGATPYEVLLHAAMVGDSTRFTRQDSVEAWRVLHPLLDSPPPVHPHAKGSWGPDEADRLVAGYGRWHGPWVAS